MSATERFQAVFGGTSEANALISLRHKLATVQQEGEDAADRVRALNDELQGVLEVNEQLRDKADEMVGTVAAYSVKLTEVTVDRDHLRYLVMHAGGKDPLSGTSTEHQGPWTPGRPYLGLSHCFHPETGDCYRAPQHGVAAGRARTHEPVGALPPGRGLPKACAASQPTLEAPDYTRPGAATERLLVGRGSHLLDHQQQRRQARETANR